MQSTSVLNTNFKPSNWFCGPNIIRLVLAAGLATLFFSPESKAWIMQQMMHIGFFQPEMKAAALVTSETIPQLVFEDGKGKKIDISEQKGKVIFINFWATWCPPCVAELPSINRLHESFKDNDNVLFLMVDIDSDHPKAQQFMNKKRFNLPVFIPAGPIPSNMLGNSIPCTVVLDKTGKMAFRHEGGADYDNKKFRQAIQKLLDE